MVIDTSAIVAIALDEPDAAELEGRIADDPVRLVSAATVLETTIVLETRLGDAGGREFDLGCSRSAPRSFLSTRSRPMCSAAYLAPLWQGASRRRVKLRRLFFLRPGADFAASRSSSRARTSRKLTSVQ